MTKKRAALIFSLFSFLTTGVLLLHLTLLNSSISLEFLVGFISPFFVISLTLTIIGFLMLTLPENAFMAWLKQIAWWYLLILVVVILNTPTYSSHVMSLDRSQIALFGMFGLAFITPIYLLWRRWWQKERVVRHDLRPDQATSKK